MLNQQGGYFRSGDVLFWREGQGEWQPLSQLAELQAALQQAPSEEETAALAAQQAAGAAAAGQQQATEAAAGGNAAGAPPEAPARRGAQAAAAAAVPADPALAGFLSEISALEAEGAVDAPESPPPDERRFEDDDGTWCVGGAVWVMQGRGCRQAGERAGGRADREWCEPPRGHASLASLAKHACTCIASVLAQRGIVAHGSRRYAWDSSLRKFMPEGDATAAAAGGGAGGAAPAAAAAPPQYNEEDMVFVPDEEKQPEYEPPPKVGVWGGGGRVALRWPQPGPPPAGLLTEGLCRRSQRRCAPQPAVTYVPASPLLWAPLQYADLPDIDEEEGPGAGRKPQGGDAQQPAAADADGGGNDGASNGGNGGAAAGDKRSAQEAALEAARERSKKSKAQQQQSWFELKVGWVAG